MSRAAGATGVVGVDTPTEQPGPSAPTGPVPAGPPYPARLGRDALLAVAVWVLDLALFSTAGTDLANAGAGTATLVLIGYAGLGATALLWRRRHPVPVFGLVWVHAMVGSTLIAGYQPVLCGLVALYTVGAYAALGRAWLIAPALVPFLVIAANEAWLAGRADADRRTAVFLGVGLVYTLVVSGIWALGRWAGTSRRRLADAERRRVAEAGRAVAAERARISRELHDVVAHSVTVMLLQAGGARRVLTADPDRAATALGHIEEAGRQAVDELRRMLAVLVPDDSAPTEAGASGTPDPADSQAGLPGLAEIDDLVARMRDTGLQVALTRDGTPRQVAPSVGLAAYRTVQEALTNAARYAGTHAAVEVRLRWDDDLLVEVRDDGPAGAVPAAGDSRLSTGHGLLGLRERVAVVGGELATGPVPAGGFRVAARLPLPTPAAGEAVPPAASGFVPPAAGEPVAPAAGGSS